MSRVKFYATMSMVAVGLTAVGSLLVAALGLFKGDFTSAFHRGWWSVVAFLMALGGVGLVRHKTWGWYLALFTAVWGVAPQILYALADEQRVAGLIYTALAGWLVLSLRRAERYYPDHETVQPADSRGGFGAPVQSSS